jgi:hypothetical protein
MILACLLRATVSIEMEGGRFQRAPSPCVVDRSKITESPVAAADFPGKHALGVQGGLGVWWWLGRFSVPRSTMSDESPIAARGPSSSTRGFLHLAEVDQRLDSAKRGGSIYHSTVR